MNNENETVHVQISNVHAQRVEQGEAAWNIYSGFRYFSSLLTLSMLGPQRGEVSTSGFFPGVVSPLPYNLGKLIPQPFGPEAA